MFIVIHWEKSASCFRQCPSLIGRFPESSSRSQEVCAAFLQSTLIQKIQDNLDDNHYFAIGISASHNVNNRTAQYHPLKDGWKRSYVELHESTNPLNILALEDDCIKYFSSSNYLTNKKGGGGGLVIPQHASWILYLKLENRKPSRPTFIYFVWNACRKRVQGLGH